MTRSRPRKGSSLIEMLVTMAIMPLPMGAAIWSISLAMESARTSGERMRRQATMDRLSVDLRRDIRCATTASIDESSRKLRLERAVQAGAATIEYLALEDGSITRKETGVRPRRESYSLACDHRSSGFFRNDSHGIVGAVLRWRIAEPSDSPGATHRIEGELGAETVESRQPRVERPSDSSKD